MKKALTFQDKYDALVRKDPSYEGIFIVAVKTTGIFCKPVCSARDPKPENVIFYDTVEEALQNGFRPCKRCRPMEHVSEQPDHIRQLIEELNNNPELRIKDHDLKARNIEPSLVRRWFKKNYGMTFQEFQRKLRMNTAFSKVSSGASVTATAFDTGFDSLSGFNSSFQTIFGQPPTRSKGATVITVARFTTPLGPMYAGATNKGICFLEFTDRIKLEKMIQDLCKKLNAVMLPGKNAFLDNLEEELNEYFKGKRKKFTLPLQLVGTDFEQRVWKTLMEIPYGAKCSYREQARMMNAPNAVRAVAAANGRNRLAIVIPCHRVVGSNGKLTGYAGGIERKNWLLNYEHKNQYGIQEIFSEPFNHTS